MRLLPYILVFAVATAFVADGRAQVTYTNSNTGATILLDTPSYTAIETFSGFTSISNMSWTLSNVIDNAQPASFNAYVAVWNTSTNSVVGNLTQFGATGALNLNGTANVSFTDSWTTQNPSLTYALLLANVGGAGGAYAANIGVNPGDDFFGTGGAGQAATSAALGTFQSDLQANGAATIDPSLSYTMSVTGIAATPVPEPKTAAAEIAALFVAALVGRQIWSRRKSAVTPQAA